MLHTWNLFVSFLKYSFLLYPDLKESSGSQKEKSNKENACLWPGWRNKELISSPTKNNQKLDKNIRSNCLFSRHLIDLQMINDTGPSGMRNKPSEPYVAPCCYLTRVSRPHLDGESSGGVQPTPWAEESKVAIVHRTEYQSVMSYTEKVLQIPTECPPWVHSWVQVSVCMWGNYLGPVKESPEGIRGTSAQWTLRGKNLMCTHQADWKPEDLQSFEYNTQKHLLSMGNN